MKKKIIIITIIIFVLMLIPIPTQWKNGEKEYRAILYKYTKFHRNSDTSSTGLKDGWEFKILGIHVGGTINTSVTAEHKISIRSNDKIIEATTGSFCYKKGSCIDKIDFEDFDYDTISSYYGNKLYIDNLDGEIKSIKLYDYSIRKFTNIKVDFTDEYIITPNNSGTYIFVINASYEDESIEYYFLANISETSGDEVNI